jgi:hypothetical protein
LKHVTLIPTAIRDHWHKFEERAGNMPAFSPGRIVLASLCASVMTATPAMAGEALDGARLPWPLALPFAGILLSIALGPLAVKEWWHIHYAKAAGFWAILALGGLIAVAGLPTAAASFVHSMALEYLPFILRAVHGVWRHFDRGQAQRLGASQHNDPRAWHRHREHYRNDRRLDDPDPAAHSREQRARLQRPCGGLLYFSCLEHWRSVDAAWRSAPVPWLPSGDRFLLDHARLGATGPVRVRCLAYDFLCCRFVFLPA